MELAYSAQKSEFAHKRDDALKFAFAYKRDAPKSVFAFKREDTPKSVFACKHDAPKSVFAFKREDTPKSVFTYKRDKPGNSCKDLSVPQTASRWLWVVVTWPRATSCTAIGHAVSIK